MAHTETWDAAYEADPADATADVGDGAGEIRDAKVNIRERIAKDHYMAIAGTDADHGEHSKVTFQAQHAAGSPGANKGFLYTTDVAGKAELHFKDEDDNVIILTSAGSIGSATMNLLGNNATLAGTLDVTGAADLSSTLKGDTIDEHTGAAGVTVEGVLLKDSLIQTAECIDSDQYIDGSIDAEHFAADIVTPEKIAHGTAMVVNQGDESDGIYSTGYTAILYFYVMCPEGPTALQCYARIKSAGSPIIVTVRVTVEGLTPITATHNTATYTWKDVGSVDMSGQTPGDFFGIVVELKTSNGVAAVTCQGVAIWWE